MEKRQNISSIITREPYVMEADGMHLLCGALVFFDFLEQCVRNCILCLQVATRLIRKLVLIYVFAEKGILKTTKIYERFSKFLIKYLYKMYCVFFIFQNCTVHLCWSWLT